MSENIVKPHRIHLGGTPGRYEEAVAGQAMLPGKLVKLGVSGQLIPHYIAGGAAERMFILEDALQGKSIADLTVVGEQTPVIIASPGDMVYAWLDFGEVVTQADFLTSNGNGNLKKAASTDIRLAVPLEAIDARDSDSPDQRIRVRII